MEITHLLNLRKQWLHELKEKSLIPSPIYKFNYFLGKTTQSVYHPQYLYLAELFKLCPLSKNYIHNILLFKNIIHNHPQYHPHFCRSILSKEVFFNSTLFTMLSLGTSSFTLFTQLSVIVPLYPLPSILIYL